MEWVGDRICAEQRQRGHDLSVLLGDQQRGRWHATAVELCEASKRGIIGRGREANRDVETRGVLRLLAS